MAALAAFTLRLPCGPAPGDAGPAADRAGSGALPAAEEAPLRRDALVVEDNGINQFYIESVLRKGGYGVRLATDGFRALEALSERVPDIVFMDVQMPGMDGLECARRIRSSPDPRAAQTPIVALTGYGAPTDRRRCAEAGMDWVLVKPFEEEDLLEAMRRSYPGRD